MNIPDILVKARITLDLKQKEAAEICGISRSHWANFEIGKRVPLPENVPAIAKYMRLTVEQREFLARTAIQHHADEETRRLLHSLERKLLDGQKEVRCLRVQMADIVEELRRRGIGLPESCRDL